MNSQNEYAVNSTTDLDQSRQEQFREQIVTIYQSRSRQYWAVLAVLIVLVLVILILLSVIIAMAGRSEKQFTVSPSCYNIPYPADPGNISVMCCPKTTLYYINGRQVEHYDRRVFPC